MSVNATVNETNAFVLSRTLPCVLTDCNTTHRFSDRGKKNHESDTGYFGLCSVEGNATWLQPRTKSCDISDSFKHGIFIKPVDVVVSGGAALFANEVDTGGATACGVVHCTDAAALDGCRCDDTMGLRVGTGLALSPDETRLYGTGTHNGTSCLVVCTLDGTAVEGCDHYEYPDAHGVFVTDDHLYVYKKIVSGTSTSFEVLVCGLNNLDVSHCETSPTKPSGFPGPFGMSVFDGSAYVANGDNILVCSDVENVSDCHAANITGINTRKTGDAPEQQTGLKNIFIYAIPAPGECVQCSAWGLIFWLLGVSVADSPHSPQADPYGLSVSLVAQNRWPKGRLTTSFHQAAHCCLHYAAYGVWICAVACRRPVPVACQHHTRRHCL